MKQEVLNILDHPEGVFQRSNSIEYESLISKKERKALSHATVKASSKPSVFAKLHDNLHYFIFHRFDYKVIWTMYYIILGVTCGIIISMTDNLHYVDGLFMAASSMTGAGLCTIGMYELSTVSFGTMSFLMMFGCAPFMFMLLILCRRQGFARATKLVKDLRRKCKLPLEKHLSPAEKLVIEDCYLLDEALSVLGYIALSYFLLTIIVGALVLHSALRLRPLAPELVARNVTYWDNAFYLAVAAFANAGMSITSDSLVSLADNPPAYLLIAFLVLAGNSALPIFLRIYVATLLRIETHLIARWVPHYEVIPSQEELTNGQSKSKSQHTSAAAVLSTIQIIPSIDGDSMNQEQSKEQSSNISTHNVTERIFHIDNANSLNSKHSSSQSQNPPQQQSQQQQIPSQQQPKLRESSRARYRRVLQFILDHPRRLTSFIFTHMQTQVLAFLVILLICIQYIFFLLSTLTRKTALSEHSPLTLAGIGFFQTMSTRAAGFTIMDLRALNQGLIFIYAVMMYLAAFPFVATMERSENEDTSSPAVPVQHFHPTHARHPHSHQAFVKSVPFSYLHPSQNENRSRGNSAGEYDKDDGEKATMTSNIAGSPLHIDPSYNNRPSRNSNSENNRLPNESDDPQIRSETDDVIDDENHRRVSYGISRGNHEKEVIDVDTDLELSTVPDPSAKGLRQRNVSTVSNRARNATFSDVHNSNATKTTADTTKLQTDSLIAQKVPQRFMRTFLLRHTFFLLLAILICAFSEDHLLSSAQTDVNLWYIVFEMLSAYGNVGLTMGIPGEVYSLAGAMTKSGKLVLVAVMWLGKHRGLPSPKDEVVDFAWERYLVACRYYDNYKDGDDESTNDAHST